MDASVLNTRGVISMYLHQPTAALEDFKQASRVSEAMPWPYFNRGLVYLAKSQLTQALEALVTAHRLDRQVVTERLAKKEEDVTAIDANLDPSITVNLAVVKVRALRVAISPSLTVAAAIVGQVVSTSRSP